MNPTKSIIADSLKICLILLLTGASFLLKGQAPVYSYDAGKSPVMVGAKQKVTLSNTKPAIGKDGKEGGGIMFIASDKKLTGSILLPFSIGTDTLPTMTLMAWVKMSSPNLTQPILQIDTQDPARGLSVQREDGKAVWSMIIGDNEYLYGAPTTDEWTFLVLVYDGKNQSVRLIVNNRVFAQSYSPERCVGKLKIGGFEGILDKVEIYNRVLSLKEIETIGSVTITEGAENYIIEEKHDYRAEREAKERAELDSLKTRISLTDEIRVYDTVKMEKTIDYIAKGDTFQILSRDEKYAKVKYGKDGKMGMVRCKTITDGTYAPGESGFFVWLKIHLSDLFNFTSLRSWIIIIFLALLLFFASKFFFQIDNFFMRFKKQKEVIASGGKNSVIVEHKPNILEKIFPFSRGRKWVIFIGITLAIMLFGGAIWDGHEMEWFFNGGFRIIPREYTQPIHWVLWALTLLTMLAYLTLILESYVIGGPIGGTMRVLYLTILNLIALVVTFYLFIAVLIILALLFGLSVLGSMGSSGKYRCTRCGTIFYGSNCPNCG